MLLDITSTHGVVLLGAGNPLKKPFNLLESIYFDNGTCYYKYSQEVKHLFKYCGHPIKLDLELQRTFACKYTLALYELCLCFLEEHQAPTLSVEVLRDYLGLLSHEYQYFKDFDRFVLKKAITEVNQNAELKVDVEYVYQGKKVQEIKFSIKPTKKETMKSLPKTSQVLKLQANTTQELAAYIETIRFLLRHGASLAKIQEIIQKKRRRGGSASNRISE